MENLLFSPWQFGTQMQDQRRHWECWSRLACKSLWSFWGTIGQLTLSLGPYKFHCMKLRDIPREPLYIKPWETVEEVLDRLPSKDEGFVP